MRDKQVEACLSQIECVTVGGIISAPHPVSRQSLSSVLEPSVLPKYFLSAKAASGILRRAEKRGKKLPETLLQALLAVSGQKEQADHLVMSVTT